MGFSGCRTLTSKMGQSQVTWNKSIILINLAHVGAETSFLKVSILFYSTLRPHQRRWPLCETQSPRIRKVASTTWGTDLRTPTSFASSQRRLLAPVILSPLVDAQLFPHKAFSHILVRRWSCSPEAMGSELQQPQFSLGRWGWYQSPHVCSGEYGGAEWKPLAACLVYKCPTDVRFTLLWVSSKSIKEKKTTLSEETTSKWSFPKSLVFIFVSFFQWKLSVRIS